jgi:hypothetical protein
MQVNNEIITQTINITSKSLHVLGTTSTLIGSICCLHKALDYYIRNSGECSDKTKLFWSHNRGIMPLFYIGFLLKFLSVEVCTIIETISKFEYIRRLFS